MEIEINHSRLSRILDDLDPDERDFILGLIDKDPLTGVYNRRKLDTDLELVVSISKRTRKGTSLLMIDIDEFKRYNDKHGHLAGDEILKKVTNNIERSLRGYDKTHLYRYGGEEFVVLLPDVNNKEAKKIAERIRKRIMSESPVTVSIGVSYFVNPTDDLKTLIQNSDRALYVAKGKGRNRVEVFVPSEVE